MTDKEIQRRLTAQNALTDKSARRVARMFSDFATRAAQIAVVCNPTDDPEWDCATDRTFQRMMEQEARRLYASAYDEIRGSIEMSWENANRLTDEIVRDFIGAEALGENSLQRLFARNKEAMDAFIERKTNGMTISDRVWKYAEQDKAMMEDAITVAIGEGKSARELASELKRYLNNPDALYRRVRGDDGKLRLSKAAKNYHPGRGVYRSASKNAQRLARTEINMAYRTADDERWSGLDFILGYEIRLSNNHTCKGVVGTFRDICDDLKGKYPKDFKWSGWHPQCRCFKVPILPSDKEREKFIDAYLNDEVYASPNVITQMPENYRQWTADNAERISTAGSAPIFLSENDARLADMRSR